MIKQKKIGYTFLVGVGIIGIGTGIFLYSNYRALNHDVIFSVQNPQAPVISFYDGALQSRDAGIVYILLNKDKILAGFQIDESTSVLHLLPDGKGGYNDEKKTLADIPLNTNIVVMTLGKNAERNYKAIQITYQ